MVHVFDSMIRALRQLRQPVISHVLLRDQGGGHEADTQDRSTSPQLTAR